MFVPPSVSEQIELARGRWDPVMASQIAAHVTVVYPVECPDAAMLSERLTRACRRISPFELRIQGGLGCFGGPDKGVFLPVADVDGGWAALRASILQSPCAPLGDLAPHITLVHPRTSSRGADLWAVAGAVEVTESFVVSEVAITAFDGARWPSLECVAIGLAR